MNLTFHKVAPTEKLNEPDNLTSPKAVASSSKPDQQSWIDGYICSICGFELPPGFEEERLEHSDFHLAETLQQEEAVDGTRHISNERYLCLLFSATDMLFSAAVTN